MHSGFDFANILFAGPCNRFCPFCIGKEIPDALNRNNLDVFPPANWDHFAREIHRLRIRELVFTGTTTDPQLYRHEAELIGLIRSQLPQAQISIHTNGALSLKKMATFNLYDRASISFPSFNPVTYSAMMGSALVPDLQEILARSVIPVKISCVINERNIDEVEETLARFATLGVRRVVLRRLFRDRRPWNILLNYVPVRYYRDNPVYDIDGMEVTWWNFDTTTSRSINLFADGTVTSDYHLTTVRDTKPILA